MNIHALPPAERVEFGHEIPILIDRASICLSLPKITFCTPHGSEIAVRDLGAAVIKDLGRVSHLYRNRRGKPVFLWMAYLEDRGPRFMGSIPLCLEIEEDPESAYYWYQVWTPPGMAGLNATMLFGEDGELTTHVLFNTGATVRLILLDEWRKNLGWGYLNPTVALHFVSTEKRQHPRKLFH